MVKNSFLFRGRGIYYSLFKKGIPFHLNEKVEPFFIVGSGRCGTTLLRRILNNKNGTYIPPENWALSKIIFKFRRLRIHMNWDTLVDLTVAAHYQDTQEWFDSFPSDFVREIRKFPKTDQSLSQLINQLYIYHAKALDKNCVRWGDKTPLNINYMELILQVFPKAKFIHMVRDGVDVVYSWSKHPLYENDLIQPAKRWCSAITSAKKFKQKYRNRILEIRYEDLVRTPDDVLAKVSSFLDIPFNLERLKVQNAKIPQDIAKHDHYKNVLKPITDDHVGKGRRNLNSNDKVKLEQIMNPYLKELGYEPL